MKKKVLKNTEKVFGNIHIWENTLKTDWDFCVVPSWSNEKTTKLNNKKLSSIIKG